MGKSFIKLKQILLFLAVTAIQLGYSQTKEEQILLIRERFKEIETDSTYQLRRLNGEQLALQSCNGSELIGSFENDELKKAFLGIGKSNGVYYSEYYYWNNELFFAFEVEKQYYYDAAKDEWDYDSIQVLFEARYYYSNGALIEAELKGEPFNVEVVSDSISGANHQKLSKEYDEVLSHARVKSKAYDVMLADLLDHSVREVLVEEIDPNDSTITFLDAREYNEFKVSHIEGAIWVGYDDFDMSRLDSIAKSEKIIVYCSGGYRSEKVSEKLIKANYNNVSNMYGSIFEWVNQGRPVYDNDGNITTNVHAFDKEWGRWLKAGTKVY
jgi:rhodanese-related sulfurtransferase